MLKHFFSLVFLVSFHMIRFHCYQHVVAYYYYNYYFYQYEIIIIFMCVSLSLSHSLAVFVSVTEVVIKIYIIHTHLLRKYIVVIVRKEKTEREGETTKYFTIPLIKNNNFISNCQCVWHTILFHTFAPTKPKSNLFCVQKCVRLKNLNDRRKKIPKNLRIKWCFSLYF